MAKRTGPLPSVVFVLLLTGCSLLKTAPTLKDRQNAQGYFRAGMSFFEAQRYAESLQAFDAAWQLEPENAAYEMHFGLALESVGKRGEAIERVASACKKSNQYPECHNNLAVLLFRAERYPEALQEIDKALAIPTNRQPDLALRNKSALLIKTGQAEAALQTLTESTQRQPDRVTCDTHILFSRAYLALARFREALDKARLASKVCEGNASTQFWLAYTLYRSARLGQAYDLLRDLSLSAPDPQTRHKAEEQIDRLNREEALVEPEIIL